MIANNSSVHGQLIGAQPLIPDPGHLLGQADHSLHAQLVKACQQVSDVYVAQLIQRSGPVAASHGYVFFGCGSTGDEVAGLQNDAPPAPDGGAGVNGAEIGPAGLIRHRMAALKFISGRAVLA